ncbi:hypothetical protein [Chitinivibrio alkaliphilus]|uniref:Uncharacterized protein n=1 Tax=Chitinivibrio alkaliphilus ACht1 TaxID=1313304 RepID=U7D6W3_9BACT|nr:hypothetical protein [Chitinivibrio alkaliphilus]ERP31678.1 hypothetical protein CALK_1336 [Chitinivibrio alkaliphilus ACht1]
MRLWQMIPAVWRDIPSLIRPRYARIVPHSTRARGISLRDWNIYMAYPELSSGLYQEPFLIDFRELFRVFGKRELEILNTYTVGQYLRRGRHWQGSFYFPQSLYKDSWFGVFFVFDDEKHRGRDFMLLDPYGDPRNPENISPNALEELPRVDQRCIYFSSRQVEKYSLADLETDFLWKILRKSLHVSAVMHAEENGVPLMYCIIPKVPCLIHVWAHFLSLIRYVHTVGFLRSQFMTP